MDYETMKKFIHEWLHSDYVDPGDVPDIELYMDQVTTFMDTHLGSSPQDTDEKVLTRTMINNYAKNKLIPPPIKKKYTKNHIFLLIYIYYFKNILSISEIQSLLKPLTEEFFETGGDDAVNFTTIYDALLRGVLKHHQKIKKDIDSTVESAKKIFGDGACADHEYLNEFALICLLSYDIYAKKRLVEQMIESLFPSESKKK